MNNIGYWTDRTGSHGENLVLNMESKGFSVVFTTGPFRKLMTLLQEGQAENVLKALIQLRARKFSQTAKENNDNGQGEIKLLMI